MVNRRDGREFFAGSARLHRRGRLRLHVGFGAHLGEDFAGGGGGIGGLGDGAPDHDEVGSGMDGLGGSDYPGLIAVGRAGGTHAGRDDDEVGAEFFAEGCSFLRTGDDALASAHDGERSQAAHMVGERLEDTGHFEFAVVHAGEDGGGQNDGRGVGRLGGFDSGVQHLGAARGVDGQHAHAQLGSFFHGGGDGVGNVVVLEVEEYVPAGGNQVADDLGAFGGVELHPDLEEVGGVAHGRHNLLCGGRRRNIQGDDESLTKFRHTPEVYFDYGSCATGRR